MSAKGSSIRGNFENIAEVRRYLASVDKGLSRAVAEGIESDAQPLLAETKALTPYGPGPSLHSPPTSDNSLPHIRETLSVLVRGGTILLRSSHPGAVVHEWGGTIRPHGSPITIHEAGMARRAALIELPALETAVQSRIDRLIGD
jgi:hypothetical protein